MGKREDLDQIQIEGTDLMKNELDVGPAFHAAWSSTDYSDSDIVKFLNVYFPWSAGHQSHLLLASTIGVVLGSRIICEDQTFVSFACGGAELPALGCMVWIAERWPGIS